MTLLIDRVTSLIKGGLGDLPLDERWLWVGDLDAIKPLDITSK